jgi:SOS response regulatory protein OraA/RecX
MKKEMTEQEAYLQLAALCAQAEHCRQEMLDKMKRWGLDEGVKDRIISRLVKERFVDDERYARAFVKDKVRYNKWGRRKIQQALWMKRIDEHIQQQVLDEIEEREYLEYIVNLHEGIDTIDNPHSKRQAKKLNPEAAADLQKTLNDFVNKTGVSVTESFINGGDENGS